ncbi:MAG: mechanosensitive ion channel [Bacteroidales bacterium]|nr:mechanosensitive ion channel [Bacteroidales bacterium]
MKKCKVVYILAALLAIAVPALAVFTGMDLDATLANLRRELFQDYQQISQTQDELKKHYEGQRQRMVEIAKKCNDLSLMLYSQKQDYTFDISYALEKVTQEYEDFNKNRTPYDRIVTKLNIEIDRYARLIEALRRLPPELKEVDLVPDSLAYHNDTLDAHLQNNESLLEQKLYEQVDLIMAIIASQDTLAGGSLAIGDSLAYFDDTIDALLAHDKTLMQEQLTEQGGTLVAPTAMRDTDAKAKSTSPFILSEMGQMERDTCIFYASQLLRIYAQTREVVMSDSTYYIEAWLRMKESYDYAQDYYKILQKNVFLDGQTPWGTILKNPGTYWRQAKDAMDEKFSSNFFQKWSNTGETGSNEKDSRFNNSATLFWLVVYILSFFVLWGIATLLMRIVYRLVKPLNQAVAKEQRRYIALLLACVLFIVLSYETTSDDRTAKALSLAHTFILLLMAIMTAQLIRLEPQNLKHGIRSYLSTIFTALFVISCRVLFLPNAFLNFIFPPLLLIMTVWQLISNLRRSRHSERTDAIIGWFSFGIIAIAMLISWAGYIFMALIILVWWFFLLTAILAIATIWHLLLWYKEHRLDKRVEDYKTKITYLSGEAKEKLLFSATWFYDLIHDVVVPILVLVSFPLCIRWALNIFEFNDLYRQIFVEPFIQHDGTEGFRVSLYNLLFLAGLFYVFRYLNKAIRTIWQQTQYNRFLRKYNRKAIRNNEINLSLGNSLISVSVWFVYVYIFVVTLQIPTSSLGLIAGGLSAGIGIALKDIINNFVYGIQLMGGRLRVGDWIECDGVRGAVTDINYQTTQVETIDGTTVSFLNAALFAKSFTNLTKSDSYELLKLHVSVAYGSDLRQVREVLEEAMQVMRTKDAYGREIVEPNKGIYVVFGEFGDSGIDIIVKQYVLASERIAYADNAPEIIYNALNANGITIPFPQRDLHIIADNDEE